MSSPTTLSRILDRLYYSSHASFFAFSAQEHFWRCQRWNFCQSILHCQLNTQVVKNSKHKLIFCFSSQVFLFKKLFILFLFCTFCFYLTFYRSVKDFFVSSTDSGMFYVDLSKIHYFMSQRCTRILGLGDSLSYSKSVCSTLVEQVSHIIDTTAVFDDFYSQITDLEEDLAITHEVVKSIGAHISELNFSLCFPTIYFLPLIFPYNPLLIFMDITVWRHCWNELVPQAKCDRFARFYLELAWPSSQCNLCTWTDGNFNFLSDTHKYVSLTPRSLCRCVSFGTKYMTLSKLLKKSKKNSACWNRLKLSPPKKPRISMQLF